MRYKKCSLIARRNKSILIRFIRQDMTTYSGLTMIDYYLRLYQIHSRLRQTVKSYGFISIQGYSGLAFKGYNPLKEGAKSRIFRFLSILNRPGNVHIILIVRCLSFRHSKKHYQLELFLPNHGVYEYSQLLPITEIGNQ